MLTWLDCFPTKSFYTAILSWYAQYGRKELPWRNLLGDPHRPYKVYISEIMLQQTQVKTVLDNFYTPFLQHFPTLSALAHASESNILKAWQGLGYYSRARNLHKSAQICIKHHEGQLPQSLDTLQKLPGIGRYTAGAILCFGFGQDVAFVDGNIKRLFSRLFALTTPKQSTLQQLNDSLLSTHDSFNYNQALLDLGAMICTPKNPNCLLCPLYEYCSGKHAPQLYPTPKKTTIEHKTLFLHRIILGQTILLTQSTQKLYQGLYNLITLDSPLPSATLTHRFKHTYTHYRLDVLVYELYLSPTQELPKPLQEIMASHHTTFHPLSSLNTLPLSKLCLKALGDVETTKERN